MRSGNVNIDSGVLNNAGINGNYWSSTANSSANNAYNLNFNASDVNPSNNNNRWNGFSLRCFTVRCDLDSSRRKRLEFFGRVC